MDPADVVRRRLILAASAAPLAPLLAACAGVPGTADGPPAPAPVYKVGDRWVYHGTDGFRDPLVWDETREVIAVSPGAIDIRVTWTGNRIDATQVEPTQQLAMDLLEIQFNHGRPPRPGCLQPAASTMAGPAVAGPPAPRLRSGAARSAPGVLFPAACGASS